MKFRFSFVLVANSPDDSVFWSDDPAKIISSKISQFIFFHALRSRDVSKVMFSLKVLAQMTSEKCETEIKDSYGSRSLSVLLQNQTNASDKVTTGILRHLLSLFRAGKIKSEPAIREIVLWIDSNQRTADEIMKCEWEVQIELWKMRLSILNREKYDQLLTKYFDGRGIIHNAIDAANPEMFNHLIQLLSEPIKSVLKLELNNFFKHESELQKYEITNVYLNRLYIDVFVKYGFLGLFPCPLDFHQRENFNFITFKCLSKFYESIPLDAKNRNDYLTLLKNNDWNNGILYRACETGNHENIEWVLDFLKILIEPSLIWDIEPLSHGENTVVTVLMSSGGTDKDIYYGLLALIDAKLPFSFLWDKLILQNFPLSWVNKSMFTKSEKQEFNDKVIETYSLSRALNEILHRLEVEDARSIVYALACYCTSNCLLEETLGSKKNLLFTVYATRFKMFLDFFIRAIVLNSGGENSKEIRENKKQNINMSIVLELISNLGMNNSCDLSELDLTEQKLIKSTIKTRFARLKNNEPFGFFDDTSSAVWQNKLDQVGFSHGVLSNAWLTSDVDFVFECVRKFLQSPKFLLFELALFNKSDEGIRSSLSIEYLLQIMSMWKRESPELNFVFDAAGLGSCIKLAVKWHSFNFLFLILYPSSSKKLFLDFINYNDLESDKKSNHRHVLSTKFSGEGLLYLACGTLQQENIRWAIGYLSLIDKCLVEAEMTMVYADGNTLLTHILTAFLDHSSRSCTIKEAGMELMNFRSLRISKIITPGLRCSTNDSTKIVESCLVLRSTLLPSNNGFGRITVKSECFTRKSKHI